MVVREFDQQPADSQIDRCLRYYELLQNCLAAAYSTALGLGSSRWRNKRANPTLTLVTNGTLNGNGAGNAVTSIANVVTTPRDGNWDFNVASGLTANSGLRWVGKIAISSRL